MLRELKVSGPMSLHLEYPPFERAKVTEAEKRAQFPALMRKDLAALKGWMTKHQMPDAMTPPAATTLPAKRITIARVGADFEREPLIRPFGFKGGYMSEIWQTVALLESDAGRHGIGLCSQGVLWSDAHVFASHPRAAATRSCMR